ncbi:hypothetical protein [Peptostreptococcus faecalis]|uniref:hypothetical protein n=1 Tax=Peptostreptococcus faecalis TaxID=2045015 RepID=UPI000C7CD69D|nr:hypothetical protein [Peptostreptococcus faecalis]
MISIEDMKKAEGKDVKIIFTGGNQFEGKCTYYMRPEDEDEEPTLFIGEDKFALQSEIESIEIL